ncbi:MAG TPA: hypothetical protein VK447_01810 [Myxococcaceae bacterium]|nr:hypothetical protein [Myxococcaceae bacterium]
MIEQREVRFMDPLRFRPTTTPNLNAAPALPPGLEVARARLTQLASTPAAQEVIRLLTGAVPNLTEDAGKPIPTALLPAPLERLTSLLASLGSQSRDPGTLLQEVRAHLSETGRAFTPERMNALALASGKGAAPGVVAGNGEIPGNPALTPFWNQLDPQQKASIRIQQAISKQSEAAGLITNLMKAKSQAKETIRGNYK